MLFLGTLIGGSAVGKAPLGSRLGGALLMWRFAIMEPPDREYFRFRAEAEIEAAQRARHPAAARAHYLIAGHYLDLAYNQSASVRSNFGR